MTDKPSDNAITEPLRVMTRAAYALQIKGHAMAQPETYLVLRADSPVAEFATNAEAAAYVEENA